MQLSLSQIATMAAVFVSNAAAWNVEIFTSDDCSGGPTMITGDLPNVEECIQLDSLSVDVKSVWFDYDETDVPHKAILYDAPNCQCSNVLCPITESIAGTYNCASTHLGLGVKSIGVVKIHH
ncbi:hypothetical protein BDP55DRAFT_758185 [Colletotrichum godetiae]|uniref:Uncharacterized protein n=1 Tax=Colletotrichum godetiae TaxID=1209918 RepID=A0AAJ0AWC2_9PEZI|nr:uncharacterized protein BDP55DRAFT_758185 [Colletotrichum godetiae]KAK1690050.1 hypothetical protein BDP55DRAFT_758185 [Colletotrichum godetiae]